MERDPSLTRQLPRWERIALDWRHLFMTDPHLAGLIELRSRQNRTACVTETGRVLTEADFERLATEAERGYDITHLLTD